MTSRVKRNRQDTWGWKIIARPRVRRSRGINDSEHIRSVSRLRTPETKHQQGQAVVEARAVTWYHSDSDFWDMALSLCPICPAVAHGGTIHGFFHIWRVAAVVVVACAGGIGPSSLRQTLVYVSSVECAGEGPFLASCGGHGRET